MSRILAGLFIVPAGGVRLHSCWAAAHRGLSFPSSDDQMTESDI